MAAAEKMSVSDGVFEIVDVESDLCFTPINHRGATKSTAISVEHYTETRDVRQALMASLTKSTQNTSNFVDLDYSDDEEIQIFRFNPKNTTPECSNSKSEPDFVCEICVEPKTLTESFRILNCAHAFCTDCIAKYIASKLQDNITGIRCPIPNCGGSLEPINCRNILPPEVFDRWGDALSEAMILGSQKFYCPYKDCSALLINDGNGGEMIRESECPHCRRLFCAQCRVSWHSGIGCEEFQKLNEEERGREDIMMMKLAVERMWKRCPSCGFYVEKTTGCMYMKCRCGCAFCYNCGARSTTNSHVCPKCKH